MANNGYEDKLVEAIQYIVQNAVDNAPYDRTVQATIVSCIDQTIGKYKCKYQDATFYAYATTSDNLYNPGNDVYVLIPGNDTTREKTILGKTKKLGADYAAVPEGEEAFAPIGSNCIESNSTFNLCSYKTTDTVIYNSTGSNNQLNINVNNVNRYIKQATSIIIAAKFKTSLPVEQQFRGNYGLIFDVILEDNATKKEVTRHYVLDVNQMKGNPYKISNPSREYGVFDIDGANLIKIDKVHLFCYDFPNQDSSKPDDIQISSIELTAAAALSSEELASTALTLITPRGTWFDENNSTVDIQAQVRVKGKIVDVNSQQLDYYWFVENIGITTISEKYNKYGGLGWQCLNKYNLVKAAQNGNAPVVEWNPGSYNITVQKRECPAKETKYKCVVVYNGNQVSKEVILTNYDSDFNITIESDSGTQFYYDIGTPSLITKVNGDERNGEYSYIWAMTDNNNNFFSLPETASDNEVYNNAVAAKQQLETQIRNEQAMPAASAEELEGYETIIKNYDIIMRVEGNKLHKIQVNTITNFATYKCAVYYQGTYIGTGSIVLTNRLDTDGGYSLVINNGQQVFKYNEDGVSPTSNSVENPYEPLALSFTIYNNLGEPLSDDVAKQCEIQWMVPNHNNMVRATSVHQIVNTNDNYDIYNDYTLNYQIDSRYNVAKKNNNIRLQVKYKGMSLTRDTDFTFAKEGDPGTNGTEFLCRIVPNTNNDLGGLVPMIVDNGSTRAPNFTPINTGKWFRIELWHSGVRIYPNESNPSQTTEGKAIVINWSMLRNKYTSSISDEGSINVTSDGTFSATAYTGDSTPAAANIVKCQITYDKVNYFATLPLVTTKVTGNYQVGLYENTGFQFVTYGADGRKASYDNAEPFRLKVTNLINGTREDVSTMTQSNAVTYDWFIKGQKNDKTDASSSTRAWVNDINLALDTYANNNAKRNEKYFKPNDDYDTETVNNAVECSISKNNSVVARIHIPIHFLLNKYGHKELNGWDGNSIQLDEEGGFILAPEMGAGEKDNQNRFTGVLMGKVKEANHTNYMIGLHGYYQGQKSFFLNSKNGSALFGKQGTGQIIIDPSTNKGYIYSNSFWKSYSEDGIPTNYNSSNENGEGMLIDLTTPSIRWGNGNFKVDNNGHITAKGGGTIAGWNINDTQLYSTAKVGNNPKITMDSDKAAVYSNNRNTFNSTNTGFYIGSDGFALGARNTTKGYAPFEVDSNGSLKATDGMIGNITIGDTGLYYSGSGNTDGFGLWKSGTHSHNNSYIIFHAGGNNGHIGDAGFRVYQNGNICSTKGQIGGWTIGEHKLSGGSMNINDEGSLSGPHWSINKEGYATFSDVKITNEHSHYSDGNTKLLDFGNFNVRKNGSMYATSGQIGGWDINSSSLSGNGTLSGGTVSGSTITGGSIDISSNGGYLQMAAGTHWTKHPAVSGLNVDGNGGGIAMNGAGISGFGGASSTGSYTMSADGDITITAGNNLYLGGSAGTSHILLHSSSGWVSMNSLYVPYQGNGAQLGNLWVGDHVINDSSGSQIDMYSNLDLYSASGKVVRANGTQIGGTNSTKNIKQNIKIKDTHNVLEILKKIKIYDYDYIKEFYDGQHSYGYIIDELEQIPNFNEYVHFIDNTRNKKYPTKVVSNQEDWIKFLLACVIELQKQINK